MTGKEKMHAALSGDGSPEIPAVICYEGIYIRDHWNALSNNPWWDHQSPDIKKQLTWRRDIIKQLDQDWFYLPEVLPAKERQNQIIDQRDNGVFLVNTHTGTEIELLPPVKGGRFKPVHPETTPDTPEELDKLFRSSAGWRTPHSDGRDTLAAGLLAEHGNNQMPWSTVNSPLLECSDLWGFEEFMIRIADNPELIEYACQLHLNRTLSSIRTASELGVQVIWIQECYTDLISPVDFQRINLPVMQQIVEAVHDAGMFSVYYYCGNPVDRWESIISAGADALAFEESKKGFLIDIEEVVNRVAGRCAVFGNLDSVGILQNGSDEDLHNEIERQINAGRQTDGRFIMSIGSPVTPNTSVERVRRYCDMVHSI